jgi:glycosyltransferase involved in cell wall biosynthesis
MRVGVDATSWGNRRGYGRFARNAVGRLVELDRETTYVFVADRDAKGLPDGVEVLGVAGAGPAADAASNRSPVGLVRLGAAASRAKLDALLFPSVYTYFPSLRVPTVVGIHDLIADDFPELTLPTARARRLWKAKQRLAVKLAKRLFTVSETSRRELSSRWGLAPTRIAVVTEAPDPVFWPRTPADVRRETAAIGLGQGERYLLYAGGISPHKNLETLVDGYAEVREELRLVIVGAPDDGYLSAADTVRGRLEALGLADRVVLPGFVSDEALACLYSGAAAVVLPSLAEGFGLPAVEAAACGAPVVLSDIPAHRETLGDDALFFPPRDADVLAGLVRRLLGSDMLRRSLGERGHRRVRRYTWDAAAEALRRLVHEAARG